MRRRSPGCRWRIRRTPRLPCRRCRPRSRSPAAGGHDLRATVQHGAGRHAAENALGPLAAHPTESDRHAAREYGFDAAAADRRGGERRRRCKRSPSRQRAAWCRRPRRRCRRIRRRRCPPRFGWPPRRCRRIRGRRCPPRWRWPPHPGRRTPRRRRSARWFLRRRGYGENMAPPLLTAVPLAIPPADVFATPPLLTTIRLATPPGQNVHFHHRRPG